MWFFLLSDYRTTLICSEGRHGTWCPIANSRNTMQLMYTSYTTAVKQQSRPAVHVHVNVLPTKQQRQDLGMKRLQIAPVSAQEHR